MCWTVAAVAVLVLLDAQRAPSTFFYDEWGFVQYRRGWSWEAFWLPHAKHLVAVPALIYRVGFQLFGLTSYRPFRLMGLLAHLGLCTLVFAYVRRRVHDVVAGCAGLAIALLGAGWQNIYFPFSVSHTLALAMGILAWILLDRGTRRSDAGAAAAHVVGVLTSGLGISVMIGTAARCIAHREWRRGLLVLSPAALVYAVWYVGYGTSAVSTGHLGEAPRFMTDMLAGGAGALFGRDLLWGRVLLGVLVGVAAMHHRRLRLAAAPLGCLVGDVVLVALARAKFGFPTSSRYAYEVAVLLVLVAADMSTGWRASRRALVAVVAVTALSIWGNWAVLLRGALGMRIDATITAAELRAVEWARATVDPELLVDDARAPKLFAGNYLAAVDELGSPALSDAELLVQPEATLQLVDAMSARALGVVDPDRPPPDGDLQCDEQTGTWVTGIATDAPVTVNAGDTPVELRLRRVAGGFGPGAQAVVAPGEQLVLLIPPDDAPVDGWQLQAVSDAPFSVCG